MNPRVSFVEYRSPNRLLLTFSNHEVKEFNLLNYLSYPVYQLLADENYAKNAKVFNGTVIWDDVVDFDPDTLYLESVPV